MIDSKNYWQYSVYTDVLARKRLAIIVDQIQAHAQRKQRTSLKILDLGCGIGGMTFPLTHLGHIVTGVDIDSKTIEVCNSKNSSPNATYLVGDIETVDLQEQADVVICSEVLEHSSNPDQLLRTIKKHLAPDAIAIITVPNGYSFYEIVFSRFLQRYFTLEKGLALGAATFALGVALGVITIVLLNRTVGVSPNVDISVTRMSTISIFIALLGMQLVFFSFSLSLFDLNKTLEHDSGTEGHTSPKGRQ